MNFEDCIRFILRNPNCYLATIEDKNPRVSPITVWKANKTGIYFYTSRIKPLLKQLQGCPNIEIAFHKPGIPPNISELLRIS